MRQIRVRRTKEHFVDVGHEKLQTSYAKRMSKIRSKTVEPVLGTLINFMNMKRTNSRGIAQASKHVILSALCYNLKKYLKFIAKNRKTRAEAIKIKDTIIHFYKMLHYRLQKQQMAR